MARTIEESEERAYRLELARRDARFRLMEAIKVALEQAGFTGQLWCSLSSDGFDVLVGTEHTFTFWVFEQRSEWWRRYLLFWTQRHAIVEYRAFPRKCIVPDPTWYDVVKRVVDGYKELEYPIHMARTRRW